MKNVARKKSSHLLITAALIVFITAAAAIGVTLARYRSTARSVGEMTMEYSFSSDSIRLLSRKIEDGNVTDEPETDEDGNYLPLGGWSAIYEGGSVYQLNFLLSNAKGEDDVAAFAQ
ncbi:MAG: hypothetical protein IKN38_01720, partial [Clostridia bacterium]|nr:hypothetical protein [Clostridia bacterium]